LLASYQEISVGAIVMETAMLVGFRQDKLLLDGSYVSTGNLSFP
jgi:hypothetical protein